MNEAELLAEAARDPEAFRGKCVASLQEAGIYALAEMLRGGADWTLRVSAGRLERSLGFGDMHDTVALAHVRALAAALGVSLEAT